MLCEDVRTCLSLFHRLYERYLKEVEGAVVAFELLELEYRLLTTGSLAKGLAKSTQADDCSPP